MAEVRGHQDELVLRIPAMQCWCKWNHEVECPNDWTHVIENIVKPGYMKCCEQHKDGFLLLGPTGVKVWTKEEWENSGREAELNREIASEHTPEPEEYSDGGF